MPAVEALAGFLWLAQERLGERASHLAFMPRRCAMSGAPKLKSAPSNRPGCSPPTAGLSPARHGYRNLSARFSLPGPELRLRYRRGT